MRFPVAPGQARAEESDSPRKTEKPSCSTCSRPRLRGARVRFPVAPGQARAEESDSVGRTKTLLFHPLSVSSSRSKSAFSRRPRTSRAEESDSVGRRKPSCSTCSRPRLRGARVRFPVVLGQVPCGRVGQPSEDENPRVRPALGLVFEEQECVFPSSWDKSRAEESDSVRKTKTLVFDLLSASSSRSKSAFSRRPRTSRAEESDSPRKTKTLVFDLLSASSSRSKSAFSRRPGTSPCGRVGQPSED